MSKIPEVPKSMRTCENCDQGQDADGAYCREDGCDGLDWTERLSDFRARAEAVIADLKKRVVASDHEVLQTLGKALGYAPTFPEASRMDDGQVNVGEHVPTTIAQATANRIAELTRERDEAQVIVEKFEKLYLTRELDEEERERERDEQRGQLAAMREAIEDRGCDHGVIVKDACVKCHDKCPMGLARTSDAGKPEADVIRAAQDVDAAMAFMKGADLVYHRVADAEVCHAALRELAEAVACLNGDAR